MRYKLSESYKTVADDYCFESALSWFEQPINRSEIGKKAYKTFLKNGGKRDEFGRFSKKQQFKWVSVLTGQELKEVVRPKIQVDWEKLEEESHCLVEHELKEAFELFKKHGLIREGVEI